MTPGCRAQRLPDACVVQFKDLPEECGEAFKVLDWNDDGKVSLDEFLGTAKVELLLHQKFMEYDRNKDGSLSAQEWKDLILQEDIMLDVIANAGIDVDIDNSFWSSDLGATDLKLKVFESVYLERDEPITLKKFLRALYKGRNKSIKTLPIPGITKTGVSRTEPPAEAPVGPWFSGPAPAPAPVAPPSLEICHIICAEEGARRAYEIRKAEQQWSDRKLPPLSCDDLKQLVKTRALKALSKPANKSYDKRVNAILLDLEPRDTPLDGIIKGDQLQTLCNVPGDFGVNIEARKHKHPKCCEDAHVLAKEVKIELDEFCARDIRKFLQILKQLEEDLQLDDKSSVERAAKDETLLNRVLRAPPKTRRRAPTGGYPFKS
eukprot:TRINITY_DN2001_c0_g1_i7.p1 TRINITY_DN2001_c0_g1~~TRINITY_DN2001_c0_g1_i7.p1  ORF type:complete len:376 (-),score=79.89 TRINITY_DN2001_c0_g1_i7:158-1285(-)